MLHKRQNPEPEMNGAAIVLSDGREVPITDTMVKQALDNLAQAGSTDTTDKCAS
ncbi:MAG: hypothetical protein R3280_00055 [Marinobacter sp.]|uniref:PA1571 family protein n=1 Tax=Marinobacter sp. TaxID=50741 RepID=UPI00299E4B3C|nr:PA1571 family protein [Marinobacter sp.]MDX1633004.1 hypothetical protein [Marinobacter sp.]